MKITKIWAREILDSRGNPTVQTKVFLDSGAGGTAAVPSGASTGSHEAKELRDGGRRYGGQGVLKAVDNVNMAIAELLKGRAVEDQKKIDNEMIGLDGTANKSKLGANAILSVSLACARAAASSVQKPLYKYLRESFNLPAAIGRLPRPMMNILNGGRHADSGLDVQEFMILPRRPRKGSVRFSECVRLGAEIFHSLRALLKKSGYVTSVGDEGGFAPHLRDNEEALDFLIQAIKKAGYAPGKDVDLALDCAASEFFDGEKYNLEGKKISISELQKIYQSWLKKYPLISLEDPFAEDDWEAWKNFKTDSMIVGDDLFVTNARRLQKGIAEGAANAILIKVNQIGTLTETLETIKLARENNYKVVISHRSGETPDTFIADLAVAAGADFIKAGSLSRSERVEKYNRLMEIEEEIRNQE